MKDNLTTKHIGAFTGSDTIYIKDSKKTVGQGLFFCHFESFAKGIVTGTIVNVTEKYEKGRVGTRLRAKLENCALWGTDDAMGRERMHWFDRVSGYAKDPRAEEREPEEVQSEHESYGVIEISNPSGPDRFLFGSSIPHMHSIEMTVKRARLYRDHGDRTYGHAVLLKIEMSHSQFVEMMTSTGKGSGTPVTLRYVNGKRMEDPPFTSKRRQHDQEFRLRMRNFVRDLDQNNIEVGEILEKPSISKTDRAALRSAYDRIVAEVRSNIPFFVEQFNEQMDKTVMESTSEIEAFVEGKIRQLGLERFQDEVKGMILGGSTETKELTD